MATYLKKNLSRHRLSRLMSAAWTGAGFACFLFLVVPVFFGRIVGLWHDDWRAMLPLFSGFAASFVLVAFFMVSVRQFPYSNRYEILVSFSLAINALLLIGLAAVRQFYSVKALACLVVFQIIWLGLEIFYRAKFIEYRFAVFPTTIRLTSADFPEYNIYFAYSKPEMEKNAIDAVIVEDENALTGEWAESLAHCRSMNIPVIQLDFFLENVWGRVPLEIARGTPDVNPAPSSWYMPVKNVSDKLLALLGLAFFFPAFAVIAAVLKLTSREPVLFKQKRVGRNGRKFVMYKFRSMNSAADAPGAAAGGKHIHFFGRFLRKYHLDELPQLFNVLKGDLTLVGPRPETPELTERYKRHIPFYALRTRVNQGVVGWALIHQGNVSGIEETKIKLSYDIYYMKHASAFLDIYIIMKSIWLVLFGIEKVKSPHSLGLFSKK